MMAVEEYQFFCCFSDFQIKTFKHGKNTISTKPFYFPKENKSIVSIIGIGGGAGRIVNEMQDYEFLKRYLYVFGMNRKEMEELSLPHKYLIGTDGLGSGKIKDLLSRNVKDITRFG